MADPTTRRAVPIRPERVRRDYRGGRLLDRLLGRDAPDGWEPELWYGSTVATSEPERDGADAGLGRLPDGRLVRDAIAADPVAWLGPRHVARWGADPRLLVKLLDAGERLSVQAHPADALARAALGEPSGKAEAWLVVGKRSPDACLHLGFRRPLAPDEVAALCRGGRSDALLDALHRVVPEVGSIWHVPAGRVHAIGEGILCVEVQQASDLVWHLEWWGGRIAEERAHLGLGWDAVASHLDLRGEAPTPGLPPEAAATFWMDRAADPPGRFAVLVVTAGEGTVDGRPARPGDAFLCPAGLDRLDVDGVEVARCVAPDPDAEG